MQRNGSLKEHVTRRVVRRKLTQYAGCSVGFLLLLLFTACGGVANAPLETLASPLNVSERGLVLEAEAFHANEPLGRHAWKRQGDALHALPDTGVLNNTNFVTKSPRLDYRLDVAQAGTYYVWVRGKAAGSARNSSDSVHVGLNGRAVSSADRISSFGSSFGWSRNTMDRSAAKLRLAAGTHTLNVWMREDGFAFDKLILTRDADAKPEAVLADLAPKAFGPSNGIIDIQAEAFHALQTPGRHTWQRQGELMHALPDRDTNQNTGYVTKSPRLDYRVNLPQAGTYHVWVRGKAAGSARNSSDSVHVGLNGRAVSSSDRINGFGTSVGWTNKTMDGSVAKINVGSAGTHTLNIWMREDGFAFDQLVLTMDKSYKPGANSSDTTGDTTASGPTLLPGTPTGGSSSASTNLPGVKAQRAADFIDTVGVNTHLHYQGTVYDKRYEDLIKPKLLELGVRHVRDGAYTYEGASRNTFFYKRLRELGAAGIDFNLLTSLETPYNDATDYSKLDDVVSWTDGAVVSFEGINEPDLQGISGWVNLTRDAQKKLYSAVRGNPALKDVKVLGPSPIWKAKDLGDLSGYMDYGNSHPYPGGKMPTGSEYGQSTKSNVANAAKNSGSKPVMLTETGYHNALQTDNGHAPTSEAATAKYLPRMLLAHFSMNIPRTYLYELIDSKPKGRSTDPEASFGLLRADGSEKPAFKAVENLMSLLSDSGSFTPGTLNYALSGDTNDVHQTLLQKRDGTFYLALWLGKESWDRDERRDVRVNAQDVTVTLGGVKNATLHAFDGSGRVSERAVSLQDGAVNLRVGDSVTVLELSK